MKSLLMGSLGVLLAFAIVFALLDVVAMAASYPSKPLRFVIPTPPGGAPDIIGRMVATKLSQRLGQPVIAENRTGGGGILANEMVAKANPDGYTVIIHGNTFLIQHTLQKLPYDPLRSFAAIAKLGIGPSVLIVNPKVPANSVKELIELAKQKPGKLIFGSSAIGSGNHMGMELLKIMANIDFKIVHFKGAMAAETDLIGGHIDAMVLAIPQALSHIKSGKVKVLGTGGVKRCIALPDVPAIGETVPGYELTQYWVIYAPAGTPAPIVDSLSKNLKAILATDETRKFFLTVGGEVDYLDQTATKLFLEREYAKWARVAKEANIKLE